jgi:2-polyprenyl-6-methoxyphenol hydroxylase-like FAD-dependent oxidoreductase
MHATIIGAGIAGLALAKGLRAVGFDVEVFEQAPELKPLGAGIALTANGLRALRALGLYEAVIKRGEEIRRISVLDERGHVLETTDHLRLSERFGHMSAVALHRSALHEALRSSIPRDIVHTGKRCTAARQCANDVQVLFEDGQDRRTDLLLACDGIHSAVRRSLYPEWRERFAGYTCWRGVVPGEVESGHMTESWGGGRRFGIVPLKDGQVYWFACTGSGVAGDRALETVGLPQLRELFTGFHQSVREVLSAPPAGELIWNDIFDVPPRHAYTQGRVVLLGDAAHAVTPDLGQGASQALEDAAVLPTLLARYPLTAALACFDSQRRPRTRRLVRDSRRFARIAQFSHPVAVRLRNTLVRKLPARVNERWIDSILDVHFDPVHLPHVRHPERPRQRMA